MTSAYYHFKTALTPEECGALTKYALQQPVENGTVGYGGAQVQHSMRKSSIRWLKSYDNNLAWLKARTEHWCYKANAENFGLDTRGFESWQFTEYHGCDEGHYDWHRDDNQFGSNPWERRLSMCIQLSMAGAYAGGKLELDGVPLQPDHFTDQGDVILFRSDLRHRVLRVTNGIRFSLVTWFAGPRG